MNVLLIDDHPMVNSGLTSFLEETGCFKVTGKVTSLEQAKQFIETTAASKEAASLEANFPAFIILDILLGDENGLDFLPFLEGFCQKKIIPKPPVLVCSVLEEPFRIQSALEKGASGYVSKTGDKKEILDAMTAILRGEIYISQEHSAKIMNTYGLYAKFTKRELEIINLVKKNKTNKQISQELCINIRTVENHISNIYFKTSAKNREDLLRF